MSAPTLGELYGADAKAAFDQAEKLVRLNLYPEALAVPMRESDRRVIEDKIKKAMDASANRTKERT